MRPETKKAKAVWRKLEQQAERFRKVYERATIALAKAEAKHDKRKRERGEHANLFSPAETLKNRKLLHAKLNAHKEYQAAEIASSRARDSYLAILEQEGGPGKPKAERKAKPCPDPAAHLAAGKARVREMLGEEKRGGLTPAHQFNFDIAQKAKVAGGVRGPAGTSFKGPADLEFYDSKSRATALVQRLAAGKAKAKAAREAKGAVPAYFTVLVPPAKPGHETEWHATTGPMAGKTLSRGAFKTKAEAVQWAKDHLAGNPYTVKRIPGVK